MGGILGKIASAVLPNAFKIIDDAVADKDLREKLKAQMQTAALEGRLVETEAARDIIVAEAGGESWLQRNWRPLTMLWFAGLVGAHWLGFTPPNLPEPVVVSLLGIVKVGLGGYVIGRSAEKGIREWKKGSGAAHE